MSLSQVQSDLRDGMAGDRRARVKIAKWLLLGLLVGQALVILGAVMLGRQVLRREVDEALSSAAAATKLTDAEREYVMTAEAIAEHILTIISVSGLVGVLVGTAGILTEGGCLLFTYAVGATVTLLYYVAAIRLTPVATMNLIFGILSVVLSFWLAIAVRAQRKAREGQQEIQESVPIYLNGP